jgi:hypothetical protein
MMMSVERSVEYLLREIEVLRENLPQYLLVYHKYHMFWPGLEQRFGNLISFNIQMMEGRHLLRWVS